MTAASDQPDIVIFDGDCGICNATREWAEARDREGRLKFVPFQTADLDALSPGLAYDAASRMAWFITPGGRRVGGARAIFTILTRLPGAWRFAGAVGAFVPISLLCEPFYRIVAHNRSRISGWLGLNYCMVRGVPQRM
jgi:predicted DCC family thiol-disulfide oxidoreductase YuxK